MENEFKYYKQMDDLVLDEVNVKSIKRYIGETEKGALYLVYSDRVNALGREKSYRWEVGGHTSGKADTEIMLTILKNAKVRI